MRIQLVEEQEESNASYALAECVLRAAPHHLVEKGSDLVVCRKGGGD